MVFLTFTYNSTIGFLIGSNIHFTFKITTILHTQSKFLIKYKMCNKYVKTLFLATISSLFFTFKTYEIIVERNILLTSTITTNF